MTEDELGKRLSPSHLEMLRKGSAISDEVILSRGYRTIADPKKLKEFGFSPGQMRPGLLIPLHTTDGHVELHVLRPDNPRGVDNKNTKLPDGTHPCRVFKYEVPKGAGVRIDCPPTCTALLADPSVPLWLTEGQKKADALASQGLCAVAVLGVWNWKGKNDLGGVTLLNDFDYIALNVREVRIVFDSDVMSKPSVRKALDRLIEHLQRKGAHVTIVYLPNAEDGSKMGVDDFFAQGHTVQKLEAMVQAPRPAPKAALSKYEILDECPQTIRKPMCLINGVSYAATWLYVRTTQTEGVNKKGEIVTYNPPVVKTEKRLAIIRHDGAMFMEGVTLDKLGLEVVLPEIPPSDKTWSKKGVENFMRGHRPDPLNVFNRVKDVIDKFIDFNRSLGDQNTMVEFVALYVLATLFLDAFDVIGFLWPNGDRGAGKTHLLHVVCEMAYLGQVILAGGSYASLRDMADYGATLAFDDAENLSDRKTTDPDKRALLLAGNRRGATVSVKELCGDKTWRTRYVNAFCPRLFSAIKPPDPVLASRSIIVPLIRTSDRTKGNIDPLDHKKWPHDCRSMVDDLWALGLAYLPEVQNHEEEACKYARLHGRPLEPWKAILTIARWLEKKGCKDLYQRIESLSFNYQKERSLLEKGDLTTLVIRALLDVFAENEPCSTCITCPTCTTKIGDTPLNKEIWPVSSSPIKEKVCEFLSDEGKPCDWVTADKVGRVMGRLRFNQEKETKGSKRSRYWIVPYKDVTKLAESYNVPLSEPLPDSDTCGTCGTCGTDSQKQGVTGAI